VIEARGTICAALRLSSGPFARLVAVRLFGPGADD
jgi:hypothetical protein